MKALQDRLAAYSSELMTSPDGGTGAIKTAGQDAINRRYAEMPGKVATAAAARGFGSSGSLGGDLFKTEYARSGEMGDWEGQIAQLILNQRNTGASLSEQLLNTTRGTTSTSTGTAPGTAAADGFMSAGNGLTNIATLMTLSKLMKPSGGGNAGEDRFGG